MISEKNCVAKLPVNDIVAILQRNGALLPTAQWATEEIRQLLKETFPDFFGADA